MNPIPNVREIHCPICIEAIVPAILQPDGKYTIEADASEIVCPKVCHHLFHKACIEGWTKQHNTCPTCRDLGLRSTLVYFKDFSTIYAQYLNNENENEREILSPPEDALPVQIPNPEIEPLPIIDPEDFERLFELIANHQIEFEPPPLRRIEFEPPHIPRFNPVDRREPDISDAIIWISKTLEEHPTAYATFQLGVACLQLFSTKWAQTLYRVQQGMLIFEVFAIAGKLSPLEMATRPTRKMIVTAIGIYSFMMKFYIFNRPEFSSLPEHLQALLPPNETLSLQMHTFNPRLFQCVKWLIGTKALLDGVLAYKYPDSYKYKKLFAIHLVSFLILYQRQWVSFKCTFTKPLLHTPYTGNYQFKSLDMAIVELDILQPLGHKNFINPEFIKTLYDYASEFFKDSDWSHVVLRNSKELSLLVKIPHRALRYRGLDLFPLARWRGTIMGNLSFRQIFPYYAPSISWRGSSKFSINFFNPK